MGYWSSLRDQKYSSTDSGMTDWSTGGPHTTDDIIKEMLTQKCPDVDSDQSNIDAGTNDMAGIDLSTRAYPQDRIVESLAPLSDSNNGTWYFYIYEDRIPYWEVRSLSQVDAFVYLEECDNLFLTQQAMHLRNKIRPLVGTTEGTVANDTESQSVYPIREFDFSLPDGTPTAAANDARDAAIDERKKPRQDTSFAVKGRLYSAQAGSMGSKAGARVEWAKYRLRAGHVIRINDLVPESAADAALDDRRTFFILETSYDAVRDAIRIQPDRPLGHLGIILTRLGALER